MTEMLMSGNNLNLKLSTCVSFMRPVLFCIRCIKGSKSVCNSAVND